MKKILVFIFCAFALLACNSKKPACDAEEAKTFLIEEYKAKYLDFMVFFGGENVRSVFEKGMGFSVENIETVEAGDISSQCKANLTTKVANEAAFADEPELIALVRDAKLDHSEPVKYTVTLSEDKKTLNVEINR